MQTVTIHLGVLIALIILIVLLIIIPVFVFTRSCYIKPPEFESDEIPLRPLPTVVSQLKASEITLNSASGEGAPSHQCNAPPQAPSKSGETPVVALAAADIQTARSWMANRGIGEGVNLDSWAGKYELTLDKQPNDKVDCGILLHDLSEEDREMWKESRKPVMVEGKDPVVETKGWAPSLTYPFKILLAKVIDEIKVHEAEVV